MTPIRLDDKLLKTEFFGRAVHSFETLASTNTRAFELAKRGEPHGAVVIADSQTQGRGRLQRVWRSPEGENLYLSLILRPEISLSDAPILTLVSSIALVEAVLLHGIYSQIKWPNDVLIDGRKVAGILTEMEARASRVDFVIVGIGVNLNMTGEMIREMAGAGIVATSLREAAGGREIDRARFLADLINSLEGWYRVFLAEGKSRIIAEWAKRWGGANRRVSVSVGEKSVEGVAVGVDENGCLLVRDGGGETHKIIAGDVVFP